MGKTVFVNGDPSQGIQGTVVTAEFLNAVNNHRHRGLDQDGDGALDYAVATGSGGAYAITLTPAMDAYIAGMPIVFKANHANTGAATLAVCGMTAQAIKKNIDEDLAAGDIENGQLVVVIYDGTNFQFVTVVPGSSVPAGAIMYWPTETPPEGWLERDGSAVSRTTYASLFAAIGTMYGVGDGSTTFNLPDDRGLFERGWAHGSTNDPDRTSRTNRGDGTTGDHVGTMQADEFESHSSHIKSGGSVNFGAAGALTYGALGGNETRPINRAYMPIIKY